MAGGAAAVAIAGKLCASRPTQPFRCTLVAEVTNPRNGDTTCGYKCKGWGAIATFPLPPDMKSCPKGFDGNFPARNE